MHAISGILSVVFQFTLFALLVYKIVQLVKQYLIPYLSRQIQQLKNRQIELIEKEKLVKSTLKRVQRQINHQKRMFILLEKKVTVWHKFLQQAVSDGDRNSKQIETAIVERRMLQEKNLKISKVGLEVLPRIVQESTVKLSEEFHGKVGQELLDKMLDHFIKG